MGGGAFDADIFKAYDRKSDKFVDLGYASVADPFDAKFHRALERGPDGCLYGAIALLHCADRFLEAPGGAIVKYDPRSGVVTKLGVPLFRMQSDGKIAQPVVEVAPRAATDDIDCRLTVVPKRP